MANSIYLISKNMILNDYYEHLPKKGYVCKKLGDINLEDTSALLALVSSSIYKILSQITFGDVTIFNNEQILEGYRELLQIQSTNKDLAVLTKAFGVASSLPELYILIDY